MRFIAPLLAFSLLISTTVFLCASVVSAEDQSDQHIVCAAVVPCDQDGQVLDGYREGECAPMYAELCKQQQVAVLEDSLGTCIAGSEEATKSIKKLKLSLRKTKRALRAAQSK